MRPPLKRRYVTLQVKQLLVFKNVSLILRMFYTTFTTGNIYVATRLNIGFKTKNHKTLQVEQKK